MIFPNETTGGGRSFMRPPLFYAHFCCGLEGRIGKTQKQLDIFCVMG